VPFQGETEKKIRKALNMPLQGETEKRIRKALHWINNIEEIDESNKVSNF
jgi:hypothetical protein